jgi:hypothetical protein
MLRTISEPTVKYLSPANSVLDSCIVVGQVAGWRCDGGGLRDDARLPCKRDGARWLALLSVVREGRRAASGASFGRMRGRCELTAIHRRESGHPTAVGILCMAR